MNLKRASSIGLVLVMAMTLSAFKCGGSKTKNLAVASDAVAHALANAQTAAHQGVTDGLVSAADDQQFEGLLLQVSTAGLKLDGSIRANQDASTISAELNAFLDAFNQLNTAGVAGIKNPKLQLEVSTILTGAEASVSVIAASVGGK